MWPLVVMTTDGRQKQLDFDAHSLQKVGDLRQWAAAEFGYGDPSSLRLSAPGPVAMEDDDDFLTEFALSDGDVVVAAPRRARRERASRTAKGPTQTPSRAMVVEATERFFGMSAADGAAAAGAQQTSVASLAAEARAILSSLNMPRAASGGAPPPTVTRVNEAVQALCATEIEQICAMGFEPGMATYALVATHAPVAEAVPMAIEWILGHDGIAATRPHPFANVARFLAVRTQRPLAAVDQALRAASFNAEQAVLALVRGGRDQGTSEGDEEEGQAEAVGAAPDLHGLNPNTLSRIMTDPQIVMGLNNPRALAIFESVISQQLDEAELQQAMRDPTVGPVLRRLVQLVGRPDSDDDSE